LITIYFHAKLANKLIHLPSLGTDKDARSTISAHTLYNVEDTFLDEEAAMVGRILAATQATRLDNKLKEQTAALSLLFIKCIHQLQHFVHYR